jgi:hypothetical protein
VSQFFDTNILVYAFLDATKRERALEVLSEGGLISIQVLNEFTNVALKKRKRSWPEIETAVGVIRARFPKVILLTVEIHAAAVVLAREHGLSIYDALIVAAALEAGCDTLFSEDMQHQRVFGSLRIINPFLHDAS